jgi:nucleoside triphosphate diphosphatase
VSGPAEDRATGRARSDLQILVDLVARLRAPDGCPWDREQRLGDLRAYLLEEAHELAGAIDEGRWEAIAEELGDVLFQAAFVARMAEEAGAFGAGDAVIGVEEKMIARHPHVFGDEPLAHAADADAVRAAWERRKLAREPRPGGLLQGVAPSLPALLAAYRLTQKAAGVGFDWPEAAAVLAKVDEEVVELRAALAKRPASAGGPEARHAAQDAVAEEVGDLLFTVANLARKLDVDPEAALAAANRKFRRRFAQVEAGLAARGRTPAESTLEEMDALWGEAKRGEAGE